MSTILAGQRLNAEDIDLVPIDVEEVDNNVITSTSYVLGTNPVSAFFIAPPSGRVKIQGWYTVQNSSATESCYGSWQVREGSLSTGTVVYDNGDGVAHRTSGTTLILAGAGRASIAFGLTPGTGYTAWLTFRVSGGTGTWHTMGLLVEPCM